MTFLAACKRRLCRETTRPRPRTGKDLGTHPRLNPNLNSSSSRSKGSVTASRCSCGGEGAARGALPEAPAVRLTGASRPLHSARGSGSCVDPGPEAGTGTRSAAAWGAQARGTRQRIALGAQAEIGDREAPSPRRPGRVRGAQPPSEQPRAKPGNKWEARGHGPGQPGDRRAGAGAPTPRGSRACRPPPQAGVPAAGPRPRAAPAARFPPPRRPRTHCCSPRPRRL